MKMTGAKNCLLAALLCCAAAHGASGVGQTPASGCAPSKTSGRRYKVVKAMPRLGERISGYPKWKREMVMAGGATTRKSYDVCYGGVRYSVGTERESDVIKWVGTHDPAFRTPEGLAAGDTLEKVLAAAKTEVSAEPGWAFIVYLPSGWWAAFVQGPSMTEGELPPSAGVSFFFKRDNWVGPRAAPTPVP
ncbi:MAG TPA: hypothetical protein VGB98_07005 [Pyrinomonadaceae bacterium]|jgi:hypothetical protein